MIYALVGYLWCVQTQDITRISGFPTLYHMMTCFIITAGRPTGNHEQQRSINASIYKQYGDKHPRIECNYALNTNYNTMSTAQNNFQKNGTNAMLHAIAVICIEYPMQQILTH